MITALLLSSLSLAADAPKDARAFTVATTVSASPTLLAPGVEGVYRSEIGKLPVAARLAALTWPPNGFYGGAIGVRAYPFEIFPVFFFEVGAGPQDITWGPTQYGPQGVSGIDLNRGRVSFKLAVGSGMTFEGGDIRNHGHLETGVGVSF